MNLPNTVLIGAHKAGTSSFYNWLSQHPDIFAPEEMKDFPFFLLEKYFRKGNGYLSKFYKNSSAFPIRMQGAVQYIYFPFVPKRLYEFDPTLKLILLLRNPVIRAFSAHQYLHNLGVEHLEFEAAIEREEVADFKEILDKAKFEYLKHGLYADQLEAYLKWFSPEQIHVVFYERMIENKQETLTGVFEFLGISTDFIPEFYHVNPTAKPRYRWLNQFFFGENGGIGWLKKWIPIQKLLPLSLKIKMGNRLRKVNAVAGKKDRLSPKLYQQLMPFFEKDMVRLSKLLKMDVFQIWKKQMVQT